MVWTGDPLPAQRAYELGLVNEVVPKGRGLERAREIAVRMSRFTPDYLYYHKLRLFQSIGLPLDYAMALEQRAAPQQSDEFRQGLERSLEQGVPGWPRQA